MKRKLTQAQYDAASESDQAHYKQVGEDWILQVDGDSVLERALTSERRNHSQAVKMLAQLVPELADESTNSGYVERRQWRGLVDARVDLLEEIGGADFDADAFRRFVERDPNEKPPEESETVVQLREAQAEVRRLTRDAGRMTRDAKAGADRITELEADNVKLIKKRDIEKTLTEIRVTNKHKRKMAGLVLKDMDVEVEDGVTMVTVAGNRVPLTEFGPDWAATEEGQEFVTAPDNSGAADVRAGAAKNLSKEERDKLTPSEKMGRAFATSKK